MQTAEAPRAIAKAIAAETGPLAGIRAAEIGHRVERAEDRAVLTNVRE